jgi:hypothetical protein
MIRNSDTKEGRAARVELAGEALLAAINSSSGQAIVDQGYNAVTGMLLLCGGMLMVAATIVMKEGTTEEREHFRCYLRGVAEALNVDT